MSRHQLGPRLYLRRGRVDRRTGARLPDRYFIRDGAGEIGTGCGPDRLREAEESLAAHIAAKWTVPPADALSRRDPDQVLIAEVLAVYADERGATSGLDPATLAAFVRNLITWWAERAVSDVRRSTCQAYVAWRTAQPNANYTKDPASAPRVSSETARRELELLGGAIGHWHGEDSFTVRPALWLPDKPQSPRDALTRSQAAALLRAAMGHRRGPDGVWTRLAVDKRANRAHLRRFLLIGFYTGTRHAVIRALLWEESATQAWVDLDRGIIYRRGKAERDKATKKRPIVKIPPRLLAHLRRWRAIDRRRGLNTNAVLHHGGHALAGKIRTGFEGCVRDAGLPAEVTPHWMRHSCATWLMEADVEAWTAAGFMGMTMATLETCYGHHRPTYQSTAARAHSRQAQTRPK